MGFIPGLLGIGTNNGAQFQARGVSDQQLLDAYNQTQQGLQQQRDFVNAVTDQNSPEQQLASQLLAQSQGAGPNPALQQLQMTTNQNIANQAALQGGQRGISGNPGLAARNISAQGASLTQQANAQGALLRAQQQLAAQQQLQHQQGLIRQTQLGGLQGLQGSLLGNQGQIFGALGNQNMANASIAAHNAQMQGQGLMGGIGALGTGIGKLLGGSGAAAAGGLEGAGAEDAYMEGALGLGAGLNQGGKVSEMGPKSLLGQHCASYKAGGKVAGKAKVSGDSPKNDTVPAMLSPGEVVIPRSKTKDPKKTADFVNAILGMKLSPKSEDDDEANS